ncbi:DUF6368 family protein [Streptomyces sp. NPDC058206]|uniref:DUF6368 family protein n=1 Tax=Streptomyces sp. NPDC058206 TaxID=3346382 RepID=UPI0036EB219D
MHCPPAHFVLRGRTPPTSRLGTSHRLHPDLRRRRHRVLQQPRPTALLAAAIMDVIGGVANAELREDQVPIVASLPGLVATITDPWPAAYGSAELLRAWTQQPDFRLLKRWY